MKKTLVLAASAIAAAGFGAADASAVDVELYGQVDKSVMSYDDGRNTETNFVDNDFGGTRFGFKGSQSLDNGLTASVLFEVEMQSNASNGITQATVAGNSSTAVSTANTFAERHARVGLGGDWGAVFMGHASSAADSSAEQDLAGVSDVTGSAAFKIGGGIFFRDNTGALTTNSIGNTVDNMDGLGRSDAIRYDSPVFNGFQVRVSTIQGGDVDGAVYYHGKVDEFNVKGAIGYASYNSAATAAADILESQMSGSLSVGHDSGLAATVAYGQKSLDRKTAGNDDPSYWYLKAGYAWDQFEVAAEYGKYEDMITTTTTDHETQYLGAAAQYNMGHGTSLAAYYKQFDLDFTGTNTDAINLYGVNLRVKF
jgi:predicted porin